MFDMIIDFLSGADKPHKSRSQESTAVVSHGSDLIQDNIITSAVARGKGKYIHINKPDLKSIIILTWCIMPSGYTLYAHGSPVVLDAMVLNLSVFGA